MPGILTEPQVKSEEEGEVVDYCNGSSKTVAPVAGDCTTSPSPTPSRSPDPGENGKTHSTSDSGRWVQMPWGYCEESLCME